MANRTTKFRAVLGDPADPHQYNENLKDDEAVNKALHGNRIISGFVVSDGGGLFVDISAGQAIIGRHIDAAAYVDLAVPASSVRWVWLQQETVYTVVGGVIADTVPTFQLTAAAGTPTGECALLAEVTTDGSSVTSIVDKRDWANRWVDRTTFKMGDDILVMDTDAETVEINGVPVGGAHTHVLVDITDAGALAALNTVDTAQIDNGAVTLAKMDDISAGVVIGRDIGLGTPEEIIVGAGLSMSITPNTLDVVEATDTVKGIVELAANGENAAGVVVQGNDSRLSDARTPTAHTHTLADITDEGALAALNTVGTAQIDNDAVTFAKLQNITGPVVIGKETGSGDAESLALSSALNISLGTLSVVPASTTVSGVVELATDGEGIAGRAVQGNDSRLSDPWRPTGDIAATLRRSEITTASLAALLTQRMRLDGVYLKAGDTVTNIAYWTGGTAAGTPTNWWFALYSYHASAPVLLGQTADQLTAAMAANTKFLLPLGTPVNITSTGLYYVAIMVKATTVPTLRGMSNSLQFINEEVPVRGGITADTGLTDTAPNPSGAITTAEEFIPYAQVS